MERSATRARVLLVDDEASLRQMMQVLLKRLGFDVVSASGVDEARAVLRASAAPFDLVLTDLVMPDGSGLEVLDAARERSTETQVVVVTAHASVETAVEAMRRGAYGYLEKPIELASARATFEKALEKRLLLRDNAVLRRIARAAQGDERPLVGRSAALQACVDLARRAAPSRASVMITGESGTGKEVFARMIHQHSDRPDKPFLVVNCGAIPEGLLESELFGHEKGAFTGAVARREGMFREANGGTVFLDEVAELPLPLQVKLLRAVQERRVRAVGSAQETPVDVRILAATNRDLAADVEAGRFRADLYYRLNVLRIHLPPLRERPEDIPLLLEHFRAIYAGELGRPTLAFSAEALRALLSYRFPGNVRELENAVERAVALAQGPTIEPADLPPEVLGRTLRTALAAVLPPEGMELERFLEDTERTLLRQALARADGVRTRAAQLLGLSFRSLRYRLAKLGIQADDEPDPERGDGPAGA